MLHPQIRQAWVRPPGHAFDLAAALIAALGVSSIAMWEPAMYGAHVIIRNVLGCFGVVAVSTVILGARLARAPVIGYVATVYLAAPKPARTATAWWTWPIKPATSSLAWWTAIALFAVGLGPYARFGARPARSRDCRRRLKTDPLTARGF